jgi:hypothetical protein
MAALDRNATGTSPIAHSGVNHAAGLHRLRAARSLRDQREAERGATTCVASRAVVECCAPASRASVRGRVVDFLASTFARRTSRTGAGRRPSPPPASGPGTGVPALRHVHSDVDIWPTTVPG